MTNKTKRLIGLIGVLFISMGITVLDVDNLAFAENKKAYAAIVVGLSWFIYFAVKYRKID
jgi:hypothetical protein